MSDGARSGFGSAAEAIKRLIEKQAAVTRGTYKELAHAVEYGADEVKKAEKGFTTPEQLRASPVDDIPASPNSSDPPLETIKLNRKYVGEEEPDNTIFPGHQVKYLTDDERKRYAIHIIDGKLYDADYVLYDTSDAVSEGLRNPNALFVIDENRRLYSSLVSEAGEFHHSSFVAGGPVAGAGTMVVKKGVLVAIANDSGHYKPDRSIMDQVVRYLRSRHVPMDGVGVTVYSH